MFCAKVLDKCERHSAAICTGFLTYTFFEIIRRTQNREHCASVSLSRGSTAPSAPSPTLLMRFLGHAQTHHTRQEPSGRVIGPLQRPLPDDAQHSQWTDICASTRDSNPQSRQSSGRRPTRQTPRPLAPLCVLLLNSFCILKGKGKGKGKGNLKPLYATEAYGGSSGIFPLVLKLGAR